MEPSESTQVAIVPTSQKQLAANQRNSRLSTGPKTAAGKLVVAKNALGHGVYALSPVVPGVESARQWSTYRKAILADLQPLDGLETVLAERIALLGWRLRRVARFETEQIRLTQEDGARQIGGEMGFEWESAAASVEETLAGSHYRERAYHLLENFSTATDDTTLSPEDAEDLLWHAHDQLGLKDGFDDYWVQLPVPEAWTVGEVRRLVRALAEQHGKPFDAVLTATREKATAEFIQTGRLANQMEARLDEYRRENLLPDDETLQRIQRYESHLSRQFHRDLHELQRLQAPRRGQPMAAPITIDVDVTTEPKPDTELAG